jgi:hypothetical protein
LAGNSGTVERIEWPYILLLNRRLNVLQDANKDIGVLQPRESGKRVEVRRDGAVEPKRWQSAAIQSNHMKNSRRNAQHRHHHNATRQIRRLQVCEETRKIASQKTNIVITGSRWREISQ